MTDAQGPTPTPLTLPCVMSRPSLRRSARNERHRRYIRYLYARQPFHTYCTACKKMFATTDFPAGHRLMLCACGEYRLCPACCRDSEAPLMACGSPMQCEQIYAVCSNQQCARLVEKYFCCYHCVPPMDFEDVSLAHQYAKEPSPPQALSFCHLGHSPVSGHQQ